MLLLEVHYSMEMVAVGTLMSVTALVFTYGKQIIKERFSLNNPINTVTSFQVYQFLKERGYSVLDVRPKGDHDWSAVITENGNDKIVEVITNGDAIQSIHVL